MKIATLHAIVHVAEEEAIGADCRSAGPVWKHVICVECSGCKQRTFVAPKKLSVAPTSSVARRRIECSRPLDSFRSYSVGSPNWMNKEHLSYVVKLVGAMASVEAGPTSRLQAVESV